MPITNGNDPTVEEDKWNGNWCGKYCKYKKKQVRKPKHI